MIRSISSSAELRVPHLLLLLSDQGIGALIYTEKRIPHPLSTGVSCRHLDELAFLAEKFEKEPAAIPDDELSMLFQAGSSPGGARLKALVADKSGAYLAKFPSAKDNLDVVGLESAAMELGPVGRV